MKHWVKEKKGGSEIILTLTVRENMHEYITYISKVHFAYISLCEFFSSVWYNL